MIAVWGVLFGLIIGFVRGGSLAQLSDTELKGVALLFIALAVQLLIFPTPWWPEPPIAFATTFFHLASYGLLIVFVFLNRRMLPLWGVAAGMMMNVAVIAANGGHMPTSAAALRVAGQSEIAERLLHATDGTYGNVVLISESTRLNILADRLAVPSWVPLGSALSLGDLVLTLGAAWLVQLLMVGSDKEK
ncbi:MAG: DUF5317 domain-containing protein [Spirochaetaceae bacterium]